MAEIATVPAHYNKKLLSDLEFIASKIQGSIITKCTNNNRPLKDVAQVNQLINDTHFNQVICSIDDFSKNVLSLPSVTPKIVAITVEKMRNAINTYLSGYSALCHRSFPKGYEEGYGLLIAVHKRILEQLLELFEKIIESMDYRIKTTNYSGNKTISIDIELNYDVEVASFIAWVDKVKKQHNEKSAVYSNLDNKSQNWLVCLLLLIYSLFRKRDTTLNNGEPIEVSRNCFQIDDLSDKREINNEANGYEFCTEFQSEHMLEEKETTINEAFSQDFNTDSQTTEE